MPEPTDTETYLKKAEERLAVLARFRVTVFECLPGVTEAALIEASQADVEPLWEMLSVAMRNLDVKAQPEVLEILDGIAREAMEKQSSTSTNKSP
jgi:hypothetical protein